jgi:hypothetical protein
MALRATAGGSLLTVGGATALLVVAIGLMQPSASRTTFVDFGPRAMPWPTEGMEAPNFRLGSADGSRTVELAEFRGKKPVALIFGSFT